MAYFDYIACLRYTILVWNPPFGPGISDFDHGEVIEELLIYVNWFYQPWLPSLVKVSAISGGGSPPLQLSHTGGR